MFNVVASYLSCYLHLKNEPESTLGRYFQESKDFFQQIICILD